MMAALQLCFVMVYTSGLLTTVYSHSLYLMASCFEILQFCHFETQQSFCSWSQDLLRKDLPEFTYKALESNEKRSSLTTPPPPYSTFDKTKSKGMNLRATQVVGG
jgi:hypothetical protein